MELTIKLNLIESRRKKRHIKFLQETIAELNNGIVRDVIKGNDKLNLYNKAKLLKKYNRRLKYLGL
jgi:hypothetical protein